MTLKAEMNDKMYLLINIYTPNKDTIIVEFFKDLGTILEKEKLDEEENIILGDFNCPLNPVLDKKLKVVYFSEKFSRSNLLLFI